MKLNIFSLSIALVVLFVSCKHEYVQNKFSIKSIEAIYIDSKCEKVSVSFNLEYFSDSSEQKGLVLKEMGLGGGDDTITYFNLANSQYVVNNCYGCMTFDSFKAGYNKKDAGFLGEKYREPFIFCTKSLKDNNNELMLVLYNKKSKKTDTLSTLIRPNMYPFKK